MGTSILHSKFFFCSANEAKKIKKYVKVLEPIYEGEARFKIYDYNKRLSGIEVEYVQWNRDDLLLDPLMRHYPAFTYYSSDYEEWTDDVEHFVFPMFRTAGDWCYSMEDLYECLEEDHGITNIEEYDPPKDPAELAEWLNDDMDGAFEDVFVNYVADSPSPYWCHWDEYQPLIEKLRKMNDS